MKFEKIMMRIYKKRKNKKFKNLFSVTKKGYNLDIES